MVNFFNLYLKQRKKIVYFEVKNNNNFFVIKKNIS